MKKVEQTILGVPHGNCFQAAIASYLDLDLDNVPHFCDGDAKDWWEKFREWCCARGQTPLELKMDALGSMNEGCLIWVVGQSSRGHRHMVLGRVMRPNTWCMVWDPHPDHNGLETVEQFGFMIDHRQEDYHAKKVRDT